MLLLSGGWISNKPETNCQLHTSIFSSHISYTEKMFKKKKCQVSFFSILKSRKFCCLGKHSIKKKLLMQYEDEMVSRNRNEY